MSWKRWSTITADTYYNSIIDSIEIHQVLPAVGYVDIIPAVRASRRKPKADRQQGHVTSQRVSWLHAPEGGPCCHT